MTILNTHNFPQPVIGTRLRPLLLAVFVLFVLIASNSVYLLYISLLEWFSGNIHENFFYQLNFLLHLALGFLSILPFLLFGFAHLRNA